MSHVTAHPGSLLGTAAPRPQWKSTDHGAGSDRAYHPSLRALVLTNGPTAWVARTEDEAEMLRLLDEDPAKGLLVYEATPMANAVVGHSVRHPDLL